MGLLFDAQEAFLTRGRPMKILMCVFCAFFFLGTCTADEIAGKDSFLILCYHDIPKYVWLDDYGVDQVSFTEQIEYLRTHGFNFISLEDVIKAGRGKKTLPEKSVLLTFDDAYLSFYEFVYPLLGLYGYPCVLGVVTSWIDNPPSEVKQSLMNWEQLREAADSPLVEIACHTHNLPESCTILRGIRQLP